MSSGAATSPAPVAPAARTYRYYDLILGAFVCTLLCSNLIGVRKVSFVDLPGVGPFEFSAGVLFFPISYLFGDILTEVYGYARARRVVWAGFGALAFASVQSAVVVHMPPAPSFADQEMIAWAFGGTWRIAGASLIAYFCGELVNSFVLAKLKILTKGKRLWMRTIGSTVAGEAVDSLVFYPLAFIGVWDLSLVLSVMLGNYLMKVSWEVVVTPVTYRVVAFLKRAEGEDYYDYGTNFTPFSIKT